MRRWCATCPRARTSPAAAVAAAAATTTRSPAAPSAYAPMSEAMKSKPCRACTTTMRTASTGGCSRARRVRCASTGCTSTCWSTPPSRSVVHLFPHNLIANYTSSCAFPAIICTYCKALIPHYIYLLKCLFGEEILVLTFTFTRPKQYRYLETTECYTYASFTLYLAHCIPFYLLSPVGVPGSFTAASFSLAAAALVPLFLSTPASRSRISSRSLYLILLLSRSCSAMTERMREDK